MLRTFLFSTCFLLLSTVQALNSDWNKWVQLLREEATNTYIKDLLFDEIFSNLLPNQKLLRYISRQPEKRLSYIEYRDSRIKPYRIKIGRKAYQKHKNMLERIAKEYQVDPCIIMAIWGMETSYGNYMGNFNVIQSLATLAYSSHRKDFFRKQLLFALAIVDAGHVSYKNYVGEWAGASGQPQFLPSSWIDYAVDYDKDGQKDIWNTKTDVFASIANYLHKNEWKYNEPIMYEVYTDQDIPNALLGLDKQKPVLYWQNMGINISDDFTISSQINDTSVIMPDGGPLFLVFNNFRTIMKYNNSIYYAGAISYLAREICLSGTN